MTDVVLDDTALQRWRSDPINFIEEVLHDPETGKPFVLLEGALPFTTGAVRPVPDGGGVAAAGARGYPDRRISHDGSQPYGCHQQPVRSDRGAAP
jgi:hypothetical protein